jgi:hypothetical protein
VLGECWNTDPTLRKLFHDFDAVIFNDCGRQARGRRCAPDLTAE